MINKIRINDHIIHIVVEVVIVTVSLKTAWFSSFDEEAIEKFEYVVLAFKSLAS